MTEALATLLRPRGQVPTIGAESGRAVKSGIARYRSPHGSARYVYFTAGEPVGALQVVSMDGESATIANIYVEPAWRRKGLATKLLRRARKDFKTVQHAPKEHLSTQGERWAEARRDPASKRVDRPGSGQPSSVLATATRLARGTARAARAANRAIAAIQDQAAKASRRREVRSALKSANTALETLLGRSKRVLSVANRVLGAVAGDSRLADATAKLEDGVDRAEQIRKVASAVLKALAAIGTTRRVTRGIHKLQSRKPTSRQADKPTSSRRRSAR